MTVKTETIHPGLLPPNAGPSLAALQQLDAAIATAVPNFGSLAKDGDNTYLKSSYLTLPTLLDAVRPALLAQGVIITSALLLVPGGFVCQTTLQHQGGGWRCSQFPVGDPSNAQRVAAAATYGLRINLQQLLAVVGVDDDGQGVASPEPWAAAPAPQQPPVPPMPPAAPAAPAAPVAAPQPPAYATPPAWGAQPPAAPGAPQPSPYL